MALRESLSELESLLARNDHPGQARHVRELIELHDTNDAEFVRLIQDGGMWGGSGAVWEVQPLETDERAFRVTIIGIAEEMDTLGIGCEGSRFIANVFRTWNGDGL